MKKLFLLFVCLFCIPTAIFASDNRNIVVIAHDVKATVGIDLNSINVIRYEPPYYIINVHEYYKDFSKGLLEARQAQYFFDYNKREIQMKTLKRYTSDGSTNFEEVESYDTDLQMVPKGTGAYLIGNYLFYKAYGMYFSKEMQEKYLGRDALKE